MNSYTNVVLGAMALIGSIAAHSSLAAIAITEVAPWSSGNAPPLNADWFEITNTGASSVNFSGWSMDDDSSTAGVAPLNGVASLAPGQSAIFIEGTNANLSTLRTNFINLWFGGNAPAGLLIGNYSGAGVGLSTTSDAVNIFNAVSGLEARVQFGASDATAPFQTFDNAAALNSTTISLLSQSGVNGAFLIPNGSAIGSPGAIANLAAVPEPEAYALMLAGLGLLGAWARKRND